jgi:hypothetical protein
MMKALPLPFERLQKMEVMHLPPRRSFYWVTEVGETEEDLEKDQQQLIAAGKASEDDLFIFYIAVDPPARPDDGRGKKEEQQ